MKLARKSNPDTLNNAVLLSEAEASSLAGVSIETLNSYTEFGILKPVLKNNKPFYRKLELTKVFNLVPTLDKLLSKEEEKQETKEQKIESEQETSKPQIEQKTTPPTEVDSLLPAVKNESNLIVNTELKSKIKDLEEERNWLRNRIEVLEQQAAREQMLLLREKETLREVLNATLVKDSKSFNLVQFFKGLPLFKK